MLTGCLLTLCTAFLWQVGQGRGRAAMSAGSEDLRHGKRKLQAQRGTGCNCEGQGRTPVLHGRRT